MELYTHSSLDDLWIFSLASATISTALVAVTKIRFPKCNHNMVVDEHPSLIIDSMSLHYDIIFGANFLDKCNITLDYDDLSNGWNKIFLSMMLQNFFLQLLLFSTNTT